MKEDEKTELDVPLDSPAIRRLIEELKREKDDPNFDTRHAYDRIYNRHNRS
jgi:hypothetical protein